MPYRGRFAPSPTGPLHFGSLLAALASYLDARHHKGIWFVRMEDLDPPRERPGAADKILRALEAFGLEWDGEVVYQSDRSDAYQDALERLLSDNQAYFCQCSRKDVAARGALGNEGPIYPGTCRELALEDRRDRSARIRTQDDPVGFDDRIQGRLVQSVRSTIGDFVIRRSDGLFAYQLAVVVDDAWQRVSHVLRGADLLHSTPRQIYLQRLLSFQQPFYGHIPVVTNDEGKKLSKSDAARPVNPENPLPALTMALSYLGQTVPSIKDVRELLALSVENWEPQKIPRRKSFKELSRNRDS